MKWNAFKTKVPGKWILCGEHSVLRGGTAIAFPHPEFALEFSYTPAERGSSESLQVEPDLASPVVQDLIRVARGKFSEEFPFPTGKITIQSTIPFGAGLGSSAALSVALAQWILTSKWGSYSQTQVIELARSMEDLFHGKSSGMDVSVVALGTPIRFSMREGAKPLTLTTLPKFLFTDTGLRSSTRECIQKVEAFRDTQPNQGEAQDAEMSRATTEILEGLAIYSQNRAIGLEKIRSGMDRSQKVFEQWGLNPKEATEVMRRLQGEGARASRLTGAGQGGFVVSLWSE